MPKPRLAALPAALFLGGLGITLHSVQALWNLPAYSDSDIEQSVELNLAVDLRREAGTDPTAHSEQSLQLRRQQLSSEIREEIAKERREPQRMLMAGVVMLSFALLQMALSARWHRTQPRP